MYVPALVCVKMIYHRFNTQSLGGRAYSGLSWRIFSLSRFHPSGVPTVGHSRESNIIILVYVCHPEAYKSQSI